MKALKKMQRLGDLYCRCCRLLHAARSGDDLPRNSAPPAAFIPTKTAITPSHFRANEAVGLSILFRSLAHGKGLQAINISPKERNESQMFLNRVILAGFVGADARHFASSKGKEIVRFTLATSKPYKHGNEWKERTQWHQCVIYGAALTHSEEAIQKGAHLLIEGELAYREYDRTVKTTKIPIKIKWPATEVIVHSITPLDREYGGQAVR